MFDYRRLLLRAAGLVPRILFAMLFSSFVLNSAIADMSTPHLNLMPAPANLQFGEGQLLVAQSFSVGIVGYKEARLERAARRFVQNLSRRTGLPFAVQLVDPAKATFVIHAERASRAVQELDEDESYTLEITSRGANLSAPNPLGVLRGLQTFLQLVEITPDGFAAPALKIEDKPRFVWRGLMIDVGRHFMPLDVLKRNLDGMEAVKMNVFHWHLSDNQGFRTESKKLPKLHEMGSDGLYYTQAETRELIEYARDRGIRVLPEFDVPGHATSWFVGYPELASAPGPYAVENRWGILDAEMNPANEETYRFLDKFIGEMAELFPDEYFHIGGDEVKGKQWDANPEIQKFMREHKFTTHRELQEYFNARIEKILIKHHKKMIGWDEVLSPSLPKDIVIQSWRGQKSLAEAAKQGYRGLLSFGYYLDLMHSASQHYGVDPLSDEAGMLTPEEQKSILGGEACMWTEYATPENIDSRIWPRTAVVAERLWSPQDVQDVDAMYERVESVSIELEDLGLTHRSSERRMLRRIAGTDAIAPLLVLADVVEPLKEYVREEEATKAGVVLSRNDPLNRLVDGVPPESEASRRFARAVDRLLAGDLRGGATETEIRASLLVWRENDAALQPLLQRSYLLKELIPLSHKLAGLADAGIQALDYRDRDELAPAEWTTAQLAFIEEARKPQADLLLMILPPVHSLVESVSSPHSESPKPAPEPAGTP
jgi:hexosaminidase